MLRLTVHAYPLSTLGRPIEAGQSGFKGGQFIVNLVEGIAQGVDFKERFITFYGNVDSRFILTKGDRQKEIPVIKVSEFVDWDAVDQNSKYVANRRVNSYYVLDNKTLYGKHYYSSYYNNRNRHGSLVDLGFTNRQFSNRRRFNNRNFNRHFNKRSGRTLSRKHRFKHRSFRRH